MTPITSLQNPRIKRALRLRDGRARRRLGWMLIDGIREIHRAWEAGVEMVEVYCFGTEGQPEADALLERLAETRVNVTR